MDSSGSAWNESHPSSDASTLTRLARRSISRRWSSSLSSGQVMARSFAAGRLAPTLDIAAHATAGAPGLASPARVVPDLAQVSVKVCLQPSTNARGPHEAGVLGEVRVGVLPGGLAPPPPDAARPKRTTRWPQAASPPGSSSAAWSRPAGPPPRRPRTAPDDLLPGAGSRGHCQWWQAG